MEYEDKIMREIKKKKKEDDDNIATHSLGTPTGRASPTCCVLNYRRWETKIRRRRRSGEEGESKRERKREGEREKEKGRGSGREDP